MAKDFEPLVKKLLHGVVFSSPVLYTVSDLMSEVSMNKMQLWVFGEEGESPELFAITKVASFPQGKLASVVLCAGRRIRRLVRFAPGFELWCKMQGADYIHFACNAKLMKIMRPRGYVPTAYAVYKPLHTLN